MLSPPYSPYTEADNLTKVGKSNDNATRSANSIFNDAASVSRLNSLSSTRSASTASSASNSDNEIDSDRSEYRLKRTALTAFNDDEADEADSTLCDSDEKLSVPLESLESTSVVSSFTKKTESDSISQVPSIPSKIQVTSSWNCLRTNVGAYMKVERSILRMYPMRYSSDSRSKTVSSDSNNMESSTDSPSPMKTPSRGRGRKPHRPVLGVRGRRRAVETSSSVNSANASTEPTAEQEATSQTSSVSSSNEDHQIRVHDLNLNQIEDFSPSVRTLPPGKSLRAEWKGAPMDLSNDKDLHLLHPAEAHLASVLRLPCDVYLDSKRRLFAEKVHRLRQGLPFRRTDSQKACRIDVNKASRLFGAFERIGWLEDSLFMQYLN
ncbi:Fun19 protein [Starmerella bacillaris]|uniref:Fun19 protein n=1 Tax=Starmerella bacillaris TaxID=1247836 RepID=A0AAV5RLR7_STABA|nr:Fun19 protein [Starmerella bacillaris]